MTSARDRLTALRDELSALNPWPWESVVAWIAKAKPCIRSGYVDHLADFEECTVEPQWAMFVGVIRTRDYLWGDSYDDSHERAEHQIRDRQNDAENAKRATSAKGRILALLDGLLAESPPVAAPQPDAASRVVRLIDRFHLVAAALSNRERQRRALVMKDEYDVQYLIGALLQIEFDDVRPEEWAPSYAGGASRMDFLLKAEKLVVEVKRTRKSMSESDLGGQRLIDIARYQQHQDCQSLTCFVYDPEGRLKNPRGLERDLSRLHNVLPVQVLIRPK